MFPVTYKEGIREHHEDKLHIKGSEDQGHRGGSRGPHEGRVFIRQPATGKVGRQKRKGVRRTRSGHFTTWYEAHKGYWGEMGGRLPRVCLLAIRGVTKWRKQGGESSLLCGNATRKRCNRNQEHVGGPDYKKCEVGSGTV